MKIRFDANGAHLFDRRSGMNALLDNLALPPSVWQPMPRFVSIALTNACDLACLFCYAPKHRANLSLERVVSWAHELDRGGCLGIGFGGGEPTLYPRFSTLCKRITEETELAVSFTTHGHHLTKELAAELSGNVHFMRVSMDGVRDTYTSIRGRPFAELLEKLDVAKTIAPFGINYVVNSDTVACLDEAAEAIRLEMIKSRSLSRPKKKSASSSV
jgi:MoaA/NifB/PqqE/SkfB family radical SAM enzyme